MKPHTEVIDVAVDSTCAKTGLTEGKHCSTCGEVIVRQHVISEKPHTYDNHHDRVCNVCGYYGSDIAIPPPGPESIGLKYYITLDPLMMGMVGSIGSCNDTDIVISSTWSQWSVSGIADGAFRYCTSITSVKIPSSIVIIGDEAFYGCTSLESIIFEGTVDEWNDVMLGDNWNYGVPATEVICSNGTVQLN